MLQAISWQAVPNVWSVVSPMLQRAINKSQKDYSLEDILYHLGQRNMQLWVWLEKDQIEACCISQIIEYPQRKVCQLPFVAGRMMRRWIACEDEISKWAKSQGCTQLEGFCRDGWLRVLSPRNWFKVWITMRKEI